MFDKRLESRTYKELYKYNLKNPWNPIFKMDKKFEHFDMKKYSALLVIGKCQLKPQWNNTIHLSEYLKYKIPSACKDAILMKMWSATATLENNLADSYKIKSTNPTLVYLRDVESDVLLKNPYVNIYSCLVYDHQKLEKTQMC